jgi:hypothetical protein
VELLQEEEEEEEAVVAIKKNSGNELPFDPIAVAAILQAYRAYKELGVPKYITFTRIIDNTTGINVTNDNVSLLPWDDDIMFVDEDRIGELKQSLHDHLEQEKLKRGCQKEVCRRETQETGRHRPKATGGRRTSEVDTRRGRRKESRKLYTRALVGTNEFARRSECLGRIAYIDDVHAFVWTQP